MKEEFEKWWLSQKWSGMAPLDKRGVNLLALDVWQARQPEIDARDIANEKLGLITGELREENAALKAEKDEFKGMFRSTARTLAEIDKALGIEESLGGFPDATLDAINTLKAENERLRKDAERYRWIRDNVEKFGGELQCVDDEDSGGYYSRYILPRECDEAIDAAMKERK